MAEIIDCETYADDLLFNLEESITKINAGKLAIISTEQDGQFEEIESLAKQINISCVHFPIYSGIKTELFRTITQLNNNAEYSGIYIANMNSDLTEYQAITNSMIIPEKDVAAQNIVNLGMISYNKQVILPPKVAAAIKTLNNIKYPFAGKVATIVGRTNTLGKPLANILLSQHCTVTICHTQTRNIKKFTKQADLIISATNNPNFINAQMVKKDSVVIDLGYLKIGEKISGDIYKEDVQDIVKFMNEPIGMRKLTLTFILYNFIRLIGINSNRGEK